MGKVFTGTVLKYGLLALVLLGGLYYWIDWSLDKVTEVANQKTTIEERDKTITDLRQQITDYVTGKQHTDNGYADIEQDQVDLLCAARYKAPPPVAPVAPKPEIVEVVKWRDRTTQCPTTDPEKAEPFDPNTSELRPVNEEIALQSLNNTWKAYCLAVNNKEEICAPFR
ncbi:hypothetical protein PA10_00299 [Pseudomonas phage pPa_SNUABM_DT01]|nr:hypothetical protein PA10_00299 [Pseudomonas phage pPa_SNUABM_DT01]